MIVVWTKPDLKNVGRTSEPSRENGLKLKPHGSHTASTWNSGHTRKIVSVRFRLRGHIYLFVYL